MARIYRSVGFRGVSSLYVVIGLCLLAEALAEMAGAGLIPVPRIHGAITVDARIWNSYYTVLQPVIYFGGEAAFPGQRLTAPLTYGFVHVGALHLWANMVPLALLGWWTIRRVGQAAFVALYLGTMVVAGLGFVWMTGGGPGVAGADGAVHGLAGAWLWWLWADRPDRPLRLLPPLVWAEFLLIANLVFYILTAGRFAWQLHAAGVLAGFVVAPFLRRLPDR